jgi:predicted dehydrogenase
MPDYRTAIIGCGGFAHTHARIISNLPQLHLVACCDIDRSRAEAYSHQYADGKAKLFTDFHKLFDQVKLDLVYIAIPPYAHTDEVALAAERGIHIFIEKPIALTMKLANEMVRAVKRAGVKSQVGFLSRHTGAVEIVKAQLDSGEAGPPALFSGRYYCNALHAPWWRDKSKAGSQVIEQAIHTYDICRYLLGKPTSVYCRQDNLFHRAVPGYTVEDVSASVITFDNGALASIVATNTAIPNKWLSYWDLITKNRSIHFTDLNHATIHLTDAPAPTQLTIASDKDGYLGETLDLLDAIEHDRDTRCPISEGAETLRLVLAADRSAKRGVPINLA